jgi:hypothetical protein
MREIFVDYSHIGRACRFRTRLFKSEREGLEVGEVVLVGGDSVEPRQARVIELTNDGREVELKFVAFSEL